MPVIVYLLDLVNLLLNVYIVVVIVRALISWVSPDPYNPLVRFLHRVTEPVLAPIRERLPMGMGLDFSPMIVILAIYVVQHYVLPALYPR